MRHVLPWMFTDILENLFASIFRAEAVSISKTSADFYRITRHNPQDSCLPSSAFTKVIAILVLHFISKLLFCFILQYKMTFHPLLCNHSSRDVWRVATFERSQMPLEFKRDFMRFLGFFPLKPNPTWGMKSNKHNSTYNVNLSYSTEN
jgi:hypothetical protein